jgi:putative DNA primase/helicase
VRVEQVLERLEGVKQERADQWSARCPAHEDRQASLTVSVGRDESVLLHCFADCSLDQIVHAIELDVRDLFPSRDERALNGNGATPPWGDRPLGAALLPLEHELERFVARLLDDAPMLDLLWQRKGWQRARLAAIGCGLVGDRLSIPVRDLDGVLVNHLRYRPDAQPKMLATKGRARSPLYLLLDDPDTIWIVEGETDAISLSMLGLSVIGAPGASAKAHAHWLAPVRDKRVVICFDVDEPGRRAAQRWAASASSRGASDVRVVDLDGPDGYDVGEFVREHADDYQSARQTLQTLSEQALLWEVLRVQRRAQNAPEPPTGDQHVGAIIATRADTIRTQRVRWLWRDRIPVGRVGIVFGPPGQGKSTLMATLTSDVTRAGGRVLIASAEDNAATTIVPRVACAGARLDHLELIETRASKGTTTLVLPRDLDALGERMVGRSLLIVDPLSAHLGDDVNAWSEQSVRSLVLAPLSWHANETGCSVALIMHINKSDRGDALARISGSGGFGGAARFALLLGMHPDDVGVETELEQRLVLVHVKASEGERQQTLVFRRRIARFATDETDSETALVPTLELVDDRAQIEADQVLVSTDPDERSAYSDALVWLRRELSTGPQLARRLIAQARERGDFSERTLRKAKRALRVRSERDAEGWFWVMEPPS